MCGDHFQVCLLQGFALSVVLRIVLSGMITVLVYTVVLCSFLDCVESFHNDKITCY